MFSWFKRKVEPKRPTLVEAFGMLKEAHRLLEAAGYVMADTDDWKKLPDHEQLEKQARMFYSRAEVQTRFLKEHIIICLRVMPGIKIRRKGARRGK